MPPRYVSAVGERRTHNVGVQFVVAAALALVPGCGRVGFAVLPLDGAVSDTGVDGGVVEDARMDAPAGPDAGRCPGPRAFPECERLRALPAAPVIDGIVECGLTLSPITPQGWTSTDAIPSAHSAEQVIAWHPDGIYFFVHVVSPALRPPGASDPSYCGDGVEVYVDADGTLAAPPAYDSPGTRQFIIPAPEGETSTRAVGYVLTTDERDWAAGRAIAVRTADGYVVEAFVRPDDLFLPSGTLSSGANVGIDISVNVAATVDAPGVCGRRLGQYFLHATNASEPPAGGCDGLPFCDSSAFCLPQLSPAGG